MQELPSSENQPENSQSSPELQGEFEQLLNIANDSVFDRETMSKIQDLLVKIKRSLQEQKLSIEMQRELARLLSLILTLDDRNSQKIDILDLAISTLLEQKEDTTNNIENSKLLNKASDKHSRNLVFIQEIRQQITLQSREYSSPFNTISNIIFKGSGGAYNRLISGLSWFFLVFVLCPSLFGISILFARSVLIDRAKVVEADNKISNLSTQLNQTKQQLENSDKFKTSLTNVNQELQFLNFQLQEIASPSTDNNQSIVNVEEIKTKLQNIQKSIDEQLKTVTIQEEVSKETDADTNQLVEQDEEQLNNSNLNTNRNNNNQRLFFKNGFFNSYIYYLLISISMGALGSAVSVIVRSKALIEKSKEEESDLFFTGFFRPVVGVSFAIFAIALIESGVFAGIVKISKSESRTIYLYMSIAFIAGFSERLVQDIVLRTENTFSSSSSPSEKSGK